MRKTEVLGIPLTDYTVRESMKFVDAYFRDKTVNTIGIITMKGLLAAQSDDSVKEWMQELDLTVPLDVEILRAGDIAFYNRVRDVENGLFATEFFKKVVRQKKKIYLLSDNEANLQKLKGDLIFRGVNTQVVGSFTMDSTEHGVDYVVNEINAAFADLLISNLESPKREDFFKESQKKLNVAVWMMLRADVGFLKEKGGLFRNIHDHVVKKIFSISISRYKDEKKSRDENEETDA